MAVINFIPEIWADTMEDHWVDHQVLADLVNREHEGEARKGNVVNLTALAPPPIRDYKANGRTSNPDNISDVGFDLLIDQEKDFAFYVDDVDRAQAAGSLNQYTDAATDALITDANQYIAGIMAANGTALAGATPTTGDEAFNAVRNAWKGLSKANAPAADRTLMCNSEFAGMLLGADSKLTAFDTSGDTTGLRLATLGNLLNFRVVVSDDMPETDVPAFIAFQKMSTSFVRQLDNIESIRAQNKHADIVRGLTVYGGKVTKSNGIYVFGITGGTLTGTPASEVWNLAITGAPTGGTFTLIVGSTSTAPIAYNATNATIAAALDSLSGVSETEVAGASTKTIRFKIDLKLAATHALTGGSTPGVTVTAA